MAGKIANLHGWILFHRDLDPALPEEDGARRGDPDQGVRSAEDGTARIAPHTAFHDTTAPIDAPERESIEARALVI